MKKCVERRQQRNERGWERERERERGGTKIAEQDPQRMVLKRIVLKGRRVKGSQRRLRDT
jgi:hypothetical protein